MSPHIVWATEANLGTYRRCVGTATGVTRPKGNEAAWIANFLADFRGISVMRDEKNRIGVRTADKIGMVSRLQNLFLEDRVVYASEFCCGDPFHADGTRDPVDRVKRMLTQQLSAMRIVSTERQGAFPGARVSTTVSGKVGEGNGVNLRVNDDLAMSLIMAACWYQRLAHNAAPTPTRARFTK